MLRYLKSKLSQNIINFPGWHTNKKIIVFESDDWGSTRTYNKKAYKALLNKGYSVDKCPYNKNDRIESNDDLLQLGDVLLKYSNKYNKTVKFTLNNILTNPDFNKIRTSNFNQYYYESFISTLSAYNDTSQVMDLYKEGINKNIFQPQLHGREHLNVGLWLNRLRKRDQKFLDAFNYKMFTVTSDGKVSGRRDNLDTYGESSTIGINHDFSINIKEAQELFYNTWGFYSKTFIAPCYVWHSNLEKILSFNKIEGIQGTHVQRIPRNTGFKVDKKYHYTGQINNLNQIYLTRNILFEPTENPFIDSVDQALSQINLAFKYFKPAIISTHRVNYVGSLNISNREDNIKKLDSLLSRIINKWNDVIFMSSDELLKLIQK